MGILETIKKITREEAILEERKRRNQEVAQSLLIRGMSNQEVSEITSLSVKEVTKLAERIKKS